MGKLCSSYKNAQDIQIQDIESNEKKSFMGENFVRAIKMLKISRIKISKVFSYRQVRIRQRIGGFVWDIEQFEIISNSVSITT